MTKKEQGITIGKIISKAWADETFKPPVVNTGRYSNRFRFRF